MASSFKKTKVKLDQLTYIGMLLMIEKNTRGGICHASYSYEKAKRKTMKDFDKNKV